MKLPIQHRERGIPIPVKFLRFLALPIARQRSSVFQVPAIDETVEAPPSTSYENRFAT